MRRSFTDEQEAEVSRLYAAGASARELAQQFGVTQPTISAAVLRAGGQLRKGTWSKFPESRWDEVVALYRDGLTTTDVASRVGVSPSTVAHILRQQRVKLRKAGIERTLARVAGPDGYVLVWVADDDPMASMQRSRHRGSRYVLEHRLVMARHLGRPLADHETVHHINGNKADNRIENLQIRNGRHGKGAALRCLDCGSMNVEAVTIS